MPEITPPFADEPKAAPGELAQTWASWARAWLRYYLKVNLTAKETDALALVIEAFYREGKRLGVV